MALQLRWGAATDAGRVRTVNEDAVHAEEGLWIVADGMGGHAAGDVASQTAIESLRANVATAGLLEAVRIANRAVLERAEQDRNLRGMGTTVTAAAPVEIDGTTQLEIVNVGDSRTYLFRDGELHQLTEDHSLVAELEREGRITAAEARVHPRRNIVTRVLGNEPDVEVDAFPLDPFKGDRLVLCSDGLVNEVDELEMVRVLAHEPDPVAAAGALVDLANRAGGRDNISVVIVDVVDDGDKAATASASLGALPLARPTSAAPPAAGEGTAGNGSGRASGQPTASLSPPAAGRRVTWRLAAFVVALLAIVGVAVGGTWWVARSTYYVGLQDDRVVIFRGRPGGVWFIHPTVEESTGIGVVDVPASRLAAVEEGAEATSLAAARTYVENLRAQRADELDVSSATGSTSTTTVTTVPGGAGAVSTSTSAVGRT